MGIRYPVCDAEALLKAAGEAEPSWQVAGLEGRSTTPSSATELPEIPRRRSSSDAIPNGSKAAREFEAIQTVPSPVVRSRAKGSPLVWRPHLDRKSGASANVSCRQLRTHRTPNFGQSTNRFIARLCRHGKGQAHETLECIVYSEPRAS